MASGYCEKHGKPIVTTAGQCEDCYKQEGLLISQVVSDGVTVIMNGLTAEIAWLHELDRIGRESHDLLMADNARFKAEVERLGRELAAQEAIRRDIADIGHERIERAGAQLAEQRT